MIHKERQNETSQPTKLEEHFRNLYDLKKNYGDQIEIQNITSHIYERLNVFISDRETIAIIESNKSIKDKSTTDEDIFDLLGLATYSNSESTVSSYATIFDTLWIRSSMSTDNQIV